MNFYIVVPTLNPGREWDDWVSAVKNQSVKPKQVIVIDSESDDATVAKSENAGFRVISVNRGDFNHGATRQIGVERLSDADVLVYLTQDAILADRNSLQLLLNGLSQNSVSIAYGRQLPKKTANPIEAHSRLYNYPAKSQLKSYEDHKLLGIKAAFSSNSFAAYRVSGLKSVGGFPDDVIFGEDMYVAAKTLLAGQFVAYVAEARVYHSHAYTISQDLRRYFDMGVFHSQEDWLVHDFGRAEGEGVKFVISELKYLLGHGFWLIPKSMLRTIFCYIGYRLGQVSSKLPRWMVIKLAMNRGYFKRKL